MKTKASVRSWLRSFWNWRKRSSCHENAQKAQRAKTRAGFFLFASFVPFCGFTLRLLDLNTCRSANVVLALAVVESRQIINLNHPHVQMFAGMYVKAATEGHRKRGVASGLIVKRRSRMRDAEERVRERGHALRAPVVARTRQQIVTLNVGPVCFARVVVKVAFVVLERAAKTGHDRDVTGHVLIELGLEAVVASSLRSEVNRGPIDLGPAIPIETVGVVVGPLMSIADVEFVKRVVPALGERRGRANQSNQEQEKDSGHLEDASLSLHDSGKTKIYGYINTTNP